MSVKDSIQIKSMRIVTLLPSATEIVYALGLGEYLVGVSHECDYPPEVMNKPRLSNAIVDQNVDTSKQIDDKIRETIHKGMSVYHIDQKALEKLRPDIILTQELCEVCAPAFTEVKDAVRIYDDGKTRIVSLDPNNLGDILQNILTVGKETKRERETEVYVEGLRERINSVKERTKNLDYRPRVFCLEWLDPPYVAGHWIPEMVEIAGGLDNLGPEGSSREIEWEKVLDYNPEIIFIMPCGFDIKRTLKERHVLEKREGWKNIEAVIKGRVYATDASSYFARPGPRIVNGLEILAEKIHPKLFKGMSPPGSVEKFGSSE